MPDISTLLAAMVWGGAGIVVVLAAWHLWYAVGLSRVLTAHGAESWKAWVPVLGEAEVLRLGRIDPVKVALLYVPIVSIYGLVLRAIAAHRINTALGRGAGATVLAIVIPPVWAMVIADAEPVAHGAASSDDESDDVAAAALGAGTLLPAPAPGGTLLPVAVSPVPGVPAVIAAAPIAPGAIIAPTAAPVAPAPQPAVIAPTTPPAPAAVPTGAVPTAPEAGAIAASLAPTGEAAPIAEAAPAAVDEVTSLRRRARSASPEQPADETSLAPVPRGWELVLPSGEVLPVTARTLVLGRKPQQRRGEAQYVTVDDQSRTVSKEHAQLQWIDGGWTISDLGSVNGIGLLSAAGAEERVAAGSTARVDGGFLLGDARLQLRRSGTD